MDLETSDCMRRTPSQHPATYALYETEQEIPLRLFFVECLGSDYAYQTMPNAG